MTFDRFVLFSKVAAPQTPLFVIESIVSAPWVQEVVVVESKAVNVLDMVTLHAMQQTHFPKLQNNTSIAPLAIITSQRTLVNSL
jgi:hypothetical protein